MVLLTGDRHGIFNDLGKFNDRVHLTKNDTIILLGDVGLNTGHIGRDLQNKQYLATFPCRFFCVHGNHEQRPTVDMDYEKVTRYGAKAMVHSNYPNQIFGIDGEVYTMESIHGPSKVICIGGAYSVDKYHRILSKVEGFLLNGGRHFPEFKSWYFRALKCTDETSINTFLKELKQFIEGSYRLQPYARREGIQLKESIPDSFAGLKYGRPWHNDEQPSDKIKSKVEKKLSNMGNKVDYIISHTCPRSYMPREAMFLDIADDYVDNSTEIWLDSILAQTTFNKWYCGHFHTEKVIDKMVFMFNQFRELGV